MKSRFALSLKQKFLLQQLPTLVLAFVVVELAWKTMSGLAANSAVQELNELAYKSRIYVTEMGSAMKGYLLNPKDDSEYANKKKSDSNNSEAIAKMKTLTTDPALLEIISQLGEMDEKQLDPTENEVMDLIKDGKMALAQQTFAAKYMPLRRQYDDLSVKMAEAASQYASAQSHAFVASVKRDMVVILWTVVVGSLFALLLNTISSARTSAALVRLQEMLSEIAASIRNNSGGILKSSQELALSVSSSAAGLQQSTAAMNQTASMLSQTAKSTLETATITREVMSQAKAGISVVQEMSASMAEISQSSSRLREIVRVIENISTKTNVINDVVFKTQLLAVNASIEAARAGFHGKGFAVVANEVASLAAMSGKASGEIRELLAASSAQVENIIEGTSLSIRAGEKMSSKSSEVFHLIAKAVEDISVKVDQVSVATKEQESGVAQTSTALNAINTSTSELNGLAQNNQILGEEIAKCAEDVRRVDRAMRFIVRGREDAASDKVKKLSRFETILGAADSPRDEEKSLASSSQTVPEVESAKREKLSLVKEIAKKALKKSA